MKTIKLLREEIEALVNNVIPAPIHYRNGDTMSYVDKIRMLSENYSLEYQNWVSTSDNQEHNEGGVKDEDVPEDLRYDHRKNNLNNLSNLLIKNRKITDEEHDHMKTYSHSLSSSNLNRGLIDFHNRKDKNIGLEQHFNERKFISYDGKPVSAKIENNLGSGAHTNIENQYHNGFKLAKSVYDNKHRFVDIHRHMLSAIHRNPLPIDLHTYSGITFDPLKHTKKGKMISPAFISTSHDKYVANSFTKSISDKKGNHVSHILHFHLKKGDPAMSLHGISRHEHEHEIVMSPGVIKHHGYTDYGASNYIKRVHHVTFEKQ